MDQPPPLRLPDRLTDGELVLDAPRLADAEAHLAGEDAEMRRRFNSPRPATLEETRGAFQRWIDGRAAGRPMFAYMARLDGVLIGGCELQRIGAGRADISYWLYPAWRGRGLARRAVALLVDAAATLEALQQIEAHIDPDNAASRRLVEALGFVFSGEVQDEAWDGAVSKRVVYVKAVTPG